MVRCSEAGTRKTGGDIDQRDVYVCGPDPWMDVALDAARKNGVRPSQLHSERFAW